MKLQMHAVVIALVVGTSAGCPDRPPPFRSDAGDSADAGELDPVANDAGEGADDAGLPLAVDAGGLQDAGWMVVGDAGAATDAGGIAPDAGSIPVEDAGQLVEDAGASEPEPEPEVVVEPDSSPAVSPAPEPPDSNRFFDVTAEMGIDSVYYDRQQEDFYCQIVIQMGGGVALGDVDNDGLTDIFLTRWRRPAQLFMRTPTGFVDVAPDLNLDFVTSGNGATFADVDDDGDLDLFVGSLSREPDRLYIQRSDGTFEDQTDGRIPAPALSGACGNVFSVVATDVDRDGDLDLHASQWNRVSSLQNSRSRLLINNGNGVFTNETASSGLDLSESYAYTTIFGDINGDRFPDALVSGDFETSRIFANQGTYPVTFVEVTSPNVNLTDENGMGGAFADFDRDDDFDWFVTSIDDPLTPCGGRGDSWGCSGNRFYRNDFSLGQTSLLSDATDATGVREGGWGWGAAFGDIDNDGFEDLAHVNGYTANDEPEAMADQYFFQPGRLFYNLGDGTFTDIGEDIGFHDNGQGRGIVFFDYDDDGALDVLVTNNKEGSKLFRNELENRGAWLKVRLETTRSAPRGIGAVVKVIRTPLAAPMTRVIGANNTFLSAPDTVAHFGVGEVSPLIHQVRVTWPNSVTTTILQNVAPNQTLVIPEPPF